MSQIDIMEFLDSNAGYNYSCSELVIVFKGRMNRKTIARALTKILKREEYEALIKVNKIGRKTLFYGVKK